jgi:hypothetical protein
MVDLDPDGLVTGGVDPQRFRATAVRSGSGVSFALPFDPNAVWDEKQTHHITGTAGGWPVRGALDATEGGYALHLGAAWLRGSGLAAGEAVEVVLMPEGPQLATMPDDIVVALRAEPVARANYEALATFYRKGFLTWIDGARGPEKRAARIEEVVGLLLAGKKQR